MFKKVSAVKIGKSMLIRRKVRGHPVKYTAYAILGQISNKVHKILRSPIPACGGKVPDSLISPRAIKRVLHNWQQLNMRKSHFFYIVCKIMGYLSIIKKSVPLFRHAPP